MLARVRPAEQSRYWLKLIPGCKRFSVVGTEASGALERFRSWAPLRAPCETADGLSQCQFAASARQPTRCNSSTNRSPHCGCPRESRWDARVGRSGPHGPVVHACGHFESVGILKAWRRVATAGNKQRMGAGAGTDRAALLTIVWQLSTRARRLTRHGLRFVMPPRMFSR